MKADPLLSIEQLCVSFTDEENRITALNEVSFAIPQGKTICLVGESGCGKSLTARTLLRILDKNARIDSGHIRFKPDNKEPIDLAALPDKSQELRAIRGSDIAMIFQEPMSALSAFHTIGNQIIEGILLHSTMTKPEARARALEVLEAVGMPDAEARLESYTFELSGGQRQRAMIAMALVNNPKLLIADEPTTALDVTTQAVILELMRDLQKRFGMSILFITHDLGVVADIADEVVVMYLGEVVEKGPVERIFNAPRHPYTRALLRAAPHYDQGQNTRLPVIPGTVPSLAQRPEGCVFAGRCVGTIAGQCTTTRPPLTKGETESRCLLESNAIEHAESGAIDDLSERHPPSRKKRTEDIALQADAVSKHFEKKSGLFGRKRKLIRSVSDVSLELREGETLGLVGESGCGKSTLGMALAALHDPTCGDIRLGRVGQLASITNLSEPERRKVWRDLRVVFQDPVASLNPRMSVFDIVAEPLRVGPGALTNKTEISDRVEKTLLRVGMDPSLGNRYPHAFSGGQRQRIGIARALAPEPKIIIADEPVSALDVSVQAQILNLFRDLQDEFNLTYLFVSHDLNVVSNIADRVAVMYAGRIVELAETSQIYHTPLHPYSAALLGAVLTPEYGRPRPAADRLQGQPPNPANLPKGCAFAPRCPFATDMCRTTVPDLAPQAEGRFAACHRSQELALSGLGRATPQTTMPVQNKRMLEGVD